MTAPVTVHQRIPIAGSRLRRGAWAMGLTLMLSSFYPNYGASFEEGQVEGASGPVLVLKLLATILLTVGGWRTARAGVFSAALSSLLVIFALLYGAIEVAGAGAGDRLFVNQLLLWVPLVTAASWWQRSDWQLTLEVVLAVVCMQAVADVVVLLSGRSLWLSQAFVGGVGNGSSFAILACLCLAYVLFGARRRQSVLLSVGLVAAVLMTKSLFGILSALVIVVVWYLLSLRRLAILIGVPSLAVVSGYTALFWIRSSGAAGEFVVRKLESLGGFLGVVEGAAVTSSSVLNRVEIHREFAATAASDSYAALLGGVAGGQYFGVDSQYLTIAGSFGLVALAAFVTLHLELGRALLRMPRSPTRSVSLAHFTLFSAMFFVNRVLDYYPVAFFYFLLFVIADSEHRPDSERTRSGVFDSAGRR